MTETASTVKIGQMRKLLTMAENASNDAEAAAYREKVFEWMAKYDVSEEYLKAIEDAPSEEKEAVVFDIRKPFVQKGRLMNSLAKQCHVVVVLGGKPKTTVQRITAYGFKQDMQRFSMVWSSILAQGEREYAREQIPAGVHPPTFKRGWWETFAVAIFQRITAEKAKAHSTVTPGTELVLVKRDEEVDEFVREMVGGLRRGKRSHTRLGHGKREGFAAGMRVDLNEGSVTGYQDRKELS